MSEVIKRKVGSWCMVGLHEWYLGSYSNPVWGRTERRCLNCERRDYRAHKPLGWITYITPKGLTPKQQTNE